MVYADIIRIMVSLDSMVHKRLLMDSSDLVQKSYVFVLEENETSNTLIVENEDHSIDELVWLLRPQETFKLNTDASISPNGRHTWGSFMEPRILRQYFQARETLFRRC